jgi:hypothetical protein
VMVIEKKPNPPQFIAAPSVSLPQRELEHRLSLSEFQSSTAAIPIMERLTTKALSPHSLPLIPITEVTSTNNSTTPGVDTSALFGDLGTLLDTGNNKSRASFLGIEEHGERILILFDISQTVVNKSRQAGVSMNHIREEVIRLIQGLESRTLFGLIQFSRIYETFQDFLIPATQGNKTIAIHWMHERFASEAGTIPGNRGVRTYPRGIETVLDVAYAMQPDVIFLISDGAFWRTTAPGQQQRIPHTDLRRQIERLQANTPNPPRLHFIGFQMRPADKTSLQSIIRSTGGSLLEINVR